MILLIIQIVIGIALITVILFQQRSSDLGGAFGGGGGGEFFHTKRGAEKILFRSTIVLSILFLALALLKIAGL